MRFNFRDPLFLPPGEPFWISFYATMGLHQDTRLRTNSMFWVVLNTDVNSTPIELPNNNFVFRDRENQLRVGWTDWTDGAVVENAEGMVGAAHNLAFSLFFTCLVTEVVIPVETPQPTPSENTNISVQTEVPSFLTPSDGTEQNTTYEKSGTPAHVIAAVSISLVTLFICIVGVVLTILWKRRGVTNKTKKKNTLLTSSPHVVGSGIIPAEGEDNTEVSLFDSIEDHLNGINTTSPITTTTTTTTTYVNINMNSSVHKSSPVIFSSSPPSYKSSLSNYTMDDTIIPDEDH
jgi:hypothetical protein